MSSPTRSTSQSYFSTEHAAISRPSANRAATMLPGSPTPIDADAFVAAASPSRPAQTPVWYAQARMDVGAQLTDLRLRTRQALRHPDVVDVVGRAAKVAVGGAIVVGVAAVLYGAGITPNLLQSLYGPSIIEQFASHVYVVGPILALLVSMGGVYGALSLALVVQTMTQSLFADRAGPGSTLNWLSLHAAMGLALSPLAAPGLPINAILAATAAAGVCTLSWYATAALRDPAPPSPEVSIVLAGVALGLAPMGAVLAGGAARDFALRQAIGFPVLAFLGVAGYSLLRHLWAQFRTSGGSSESVTELPLQHAKLAQNNSAPAAEAEIFIPQPLLRQLRGPFAAWQESILQPKGDDIQCFWLRGRKGDGRRSVAQAIAAELGTRCYEPRVPLQSNPAWETELGAVFDSCGHVAERLRRPVVLYLADIDRLAPQRLNEEHSAIGEEDSEARNDKLTANLLTLMEPSDNPQKRRNIIVICSEPPKTQHADDDGETDIDGGIVSRLEIVYDLPKPDAQTMSQIARRKLHKALSNSNIIQPHLQQWWPKREDVSGFSQAYDELVAHALREQWTVRHVVHVGELLAWQLKMKFMDFGRGQPRAQVAPTFPFDVVFADVLKVACRPPRKVARSRRSHTAGRSE